MLRFAFLAATLPLMACKPSASQDYAVRGEAVEERTTPSLPVASPDTQGAEWVRSTDGERLLYGQPGQTPYFALGCEDGMLAYTRFVAADADAKAVLALIGNGHVVRLWIDAEQQGDAWLWRGHLPADDPRLEVLTGRNRVEATVPGAGSLILNASGAPGEFVSRCAAAMASSRPDPLPENAPALEPVPARPEGPV